AGSGCTARPGRVPSCRSSCRSTTPRQRSDELRPSFLWRAGRRGRIDPGRLDLSRVVLALDRPEHGLGLGGAQPPSGVLGEHTFDDRAQRAGAQERCRPVDKNSGEGGEQRARSKGGLPSTAANNVAPSENMSLAGPESPPSSRSGETYAGVP